MNIEKKPCSQTDQNNDLEAGQDKDMNLFKEPLNPQSIESNQIQDVRPSKDQFIIANIDEEMQS